MQGMFADQPLSPFESDLPPEALRVLALARRLTTPCGDGELVWHAWGDDGDQPLVLLHGGSGSWTHWIRNVEAFAAAGRRVLVPDLPASATRPGRPRARMPTPLRPRSPTACAAWPATRHSM